MTLEKEIKETLVESLKLVDIQPEDIQDEEPLFDEHIGLDSLDAVEIVVMFKRHFDIDIRDRNKAREIFYSVKTMADHIREQRGEKI